MPMIPARAAGVHHRGPPSTARGGAEQKLYENLVMDASSEERIQRPPLNPLTMDHKMTMMRMTRYASTMVQASGWRYPLVRCVRSCFRDTR